MSFEFLFFAFIVFVFCFFTMILFVRVILSVVNSARPEGMKEIKVFSKPKKQREAEKKAEEERRQFDTIMRNLDAYDGTEIGQEEVR